MNIIKSMREKISASLHDHLGKISSATISSYFILGNILLSSTVYLIIELVNAHTMWSSGHVYNIPLEHVGIFSLVLTHHLILLGIKSSNSKSLFPNITKTIEEKHYTGVDTADNADVSEVSQSGDENDEQEDMSPPKVSRTRTKTRTSARIESVEDDDVFDADAAPMGARVSDVMDDEDEPVTPKPKRK